MNETSANGTANRFDLGDESPAPETSTAYALKAVCASAVYDFGNYHRPNDKVREEISRTWPALTWANDGALLVGPKSQVREAVAFAHAAEWVHRSL